MTPDFSCSFPPLKKTTRSWEYIEKYIKWAECTTQVPEFVPNCTTSSAGIIAQLQNLSRAISDASCA